MQSLFKDRRAITLLLVSTLGILSNTLISPALPGIEARFPGEANAALITRMLVTAPSLLVAITAPFAGAFVDRFGRKRLLLVGAFLFALAGTAGLWLPTLTMILASRMALGVGVAFITTAQAALVGDYFSGADRSGFMGMQIATTNFGGFLFMILAGWLAGLSPFLPFALYGVGMLFLPLIWLYLTEPSRSRQARHADGDAPASGWLPMLGMVIALAATSFACFYLVPTQVPFYLVTIGHAEPSAAGLVMSSLTLAGGIASLCFGKTRRRIGHAGTIALGYGFFAAGFVLLALAGGLALMILAGLLLGAATGFIMPTFLSAPLDVAPAHRRGLAVGAVATSIFLGQFLSPLLSQPVIARLGYAETFGCTAGLLVVLGAVSLRVFRQRGAAPAR